MITGAQKAQYGIVIDAQNKTQKAFRQIQKEFDNTSKKVQKFENRLKKMKPAFQKMAGYGTVAFGAVAFAVKNVTEAYQAQERAEKRLEHLTRQTSNATEAQIEVLKKQARALQQVGVVGDEVVMFGQSQLATFALQTDAIGMLTPALLDMVVAVKGVNASQEDMLNIANLVGKVMTGEVGALSRYGVTFSDVQAEILKTGTEMERAAALSEILAGNFGGLNEAMRNTSEGGMQALKNDFGDLKEEIGRAFIPLLTKAVEVLKPMVESTKEWVTQNQDLVVKITGAIAGLSLLSVTIGSVMLVMLPLIKAVRSLAAALIFLNANPLSLLLITFALIAQVLKDQIAALYGVKVTWLDVWNEISAFVNHALEMIGLAIFDITDRISKAIDWIADKIEKAMALINRFKSAVSAVASIGVGAINPVAGLMTRLPMPSFATGGVVNAPVGQPVLATVHGGEEVIPYNRRGRTGGGVTVNINGGYFLDEHSARRIGDEIVRAVQSQFRF